MSPPTQYENEVSAQALLFNSEKAGKALRVACRSLLKEFVDNSYIGTDPHGTLYYNDDKKLKGSCFYKVTKVTENKKDYVRIVFSLTKESEAFAEFYGEDFQNAVKDTDMDGHSNNGKWQDLDATETPAAITRSSNSDTVTLTLDAKHKDNFVKFKQATIKLGMPDHNLSKDSLDDVQGIFTFKSSDKLKDEGLCANWTPDRIVFYKNDFVAKDWVGFFMPIASASAKIGEPVPKEHVFGGVVWGPTAN